jgi:two-component system sensor histidine kinase VicK
MEDFNILQTQLAASQNREHELRARLADLSDFIEQAAMPLHWVDVRGAWVIVFIAKFYL